MLQDDISDFYILRRGRKRKEKENSKDLNILKHLHDSIGKTVSPIFGDTLIYAIGILFVCSLDEIQQVLYSYK